MTPEEAMKHLETGRTDYSGFRSSNSPGIIAAFLKTGSTLPLDGIKGDMLIYIGHSSKLQKRIVKQHFETGRTGQSSLRRSLGAILKAELKLAATHRGKGESEKDFDHYMFTSEGERRLSDWMRNNLEVSAVNVSQGYEGLKKNMCFEFKPLLDLVHCVHRFQPHISRLREICKQEALNNTR